jgi:hypothetical protein
MNAILICYRRSQIIELSTFSKDLLAFKIINAGKRIARCYGVRDG